MGADQIYRRWGGVRTLVFVASVAAAGTCGVSYRMDQRHLRALTEAVASGAASPADRVLALLHWAHDRPGTARNTDHFVWRWLGATPLQVARRGGDCADKSRLLCAVLREAGIPATPAMCYDQATGRPTHTIVEARIGASRYMVVDPAYDLWFPSGDGATPYDLLDLRTRPERVAERIADLRQANPVLTEADEYYLRSSAAYHTASTFNWNKNFLARTVRDALRPFLGDEVYRVPRPALLEEPKLVVGVACLTPALCGLAMGLARRLIRSLRGATATRRTAAAGLSASFSP